MQAIGEVLCHRWLSALQIEVFPYILLRKLYKIPVRHRKTFHLVAYKMYQNKVQKALPAAMWFAACCFKLMKHAALREEEEEALAIVLKHCL